MFSSLSSVVPRSFLRYAVVGLIQNGASYLIGLVLIALGWTAWQVMGALTPLAVLATFLANRYWSFSERRGSIPRAALGRYVVAYGLAYPVAMGLAYAIERLGVPAWLTLLLTIGIAAVALYLALNFWVFRTEDGGKAPSSGTGGPVDRP